jgi:predicted acyl esterase
MTIDWHTPITMDDGNVLRADVYRPVHGRPCPVIMTYGIYGKGLAFQDEIYAMQWERLVAKEPAILEGSTNKYQSWEVVDPERWVPDDYVVIRVDSRGAGWSPGYLDPRTDREARDYHDCIEWAAAQEWSSGKVGLLGISYYAINQWRVASLRPPHLAAIIPWEGYIDYYRGPTHHGGIRSQFQDRWFERQVSRVQYGVGSRGLTNPNTGEPVAGPVDLSEDELRRNRIDLPAELQARTLDSDWCRDRSTDASKVQVPLLSAANWGGQGIHPTGNFDGFVQASSPQKWLEVHGDTHFTHFYTAYGRDLQKRFLDHFLKGIDNGWDRQPPVQLNIRRPGEVFTIRHEEAWPIPRTQWTKQYLDTAGGDLRPDLPPDGHSASYDALGDGLVFTMPSPEKELEITGPMAAKLFVSSTTTDVDLFLVLMLFDPDGKEVTFDGALDPNTPIANGWLRASHRAIDPARSRSYQPFHPHDRVELLQPGEIYELDVEIWPSCIVVPPGYQLRLAVRGKDYVYTGDVEEYGEKFYYATRGTGGMTHDDPVDRPVDVFGGQVTVHSGSETPSHLLLPVIPS